jgi:hypothetical protein
VLETNTPGWTCIATSSLDNGKAISPPGQSTSTVARVSDQIPLSNDEIEVACDLLWFVKREADLSRIGEDLWERLQPIRHGDYGGTASTQLSQEEARAVVDAGDFTHPRVPLDDDETALVVRLRSLLEGA